jgi:phosphorylase kinase alpha/beta subunit
MMALAALVERTPALFIDDFLALEAVIDQAVRLAWQDRFPDRADGYEEERAAARESFYDTSPQACSAYVVKALQFLTGLGTG